MYTLSMRPNTNNHAVDICMNYEQASAAWGQSTFGELGEGRATDVGISFYTPLESIDITPHEVAQLIVGLETAYNKLCATLYAAADEHLNKGLYGSAKEFIKYVPEGIWRAKAQDWRELFEEENGKFIHLYKPDAGMATWDGYRWGFVPNGDTGGMEFTAAGECFGWRVLYNDQMDMDMVRDPGDMLVMIAGLADALIEVVGDERIYTAGLSIMG